MEFCKISWITTPLSACKPLEEVALFKVCYLRIAVDCRVLVYQCIFLFLLAWEAMFTKTSWKAKHHHRVTTLCFSLHWNNSHCLHLKAGFHMIAEDRGSWITHWSHWDRKKFCDRMRSYGKKKNTSAIVYDQLQIVRSNGNQSSAACDRNVSHNILNSDPLVTRNLWRNLRDMGALTTVINSKFF